VLVLKNSPDWPATSKTALAISAPGPALRGRVVRITVGNEQVHVTVVVVVIQQPAPSGVLAAEYGDPGLRGHIHEITRPRLSMSELYPCLARCRGRSGPRRPRTAPSRDALAALAEGSAGPVPGPKVPLAVIDPQVVGHGVVGHVISWSPSPSRSHATAPMPRPVGSTVPPHGHIRECAVAVVR
jgi:hypothetical protein